MLCNADDHGGWGGYQLFREKTLRRCKVERYYRYEGVGGGPISRKKALSNIMYYYRHTYDWPILMCNYTAITIALQSNDSGVIKLTTND